MYDLHQIVARNKAAAAAGVPVKGVGAGATPPKPVVVRLVATGQIIDRFESAYLACAAYRQSQKGGLVTIEDADLT